MGKGGQNRENPTRSGDITCMVKNGSVVSEKIRFEFLYVHDLGPRSRNDLDLQYSQYLHQVIQLSVSTNFQVTGFNSF